MPARADRREQGGQVVGEVLQSGRPLTAAAQPAAERQPRRCGPGLVPGPAHAHDLGGQRVVDPGRTRVRVRWQPGPLARQRGYRVLRWAGTAWVKAGPDGLA